ncbi:MAG: L,D-transpeptidase family protein [Eubacteriales bacterium]|nr:L,D-transpeptidase family protein [Eubacteriales bacterium]
MNKFLRYRLGCMALAAAFGVLAAGTALADDTTFVPGTSVNGLGIGSLTVDGAAERIGGFYSSDYKLTIKERGGVSETITGQEIGFAVGLPAGFLRDILNQQNASGRAYGPDVDNKHRAEMTNTYNQDALNARIASLSCISGAGIVTTSDAYVSAYQEGQPFTIIPEVWGNNVDQEKTAQLIRDAVASGASEVDLEAAGCYYNPQVTASDPHLIELCDTMNRCREMQITYVIGDESQVLDAAKICSWLTGAKDGEIQVNRDMAAAWVKELAAKYNTAGAARVFHTATGRDVQVTGPYGWKINQAAETDALIGMIRTGQSQSREPQYSQTAAAHGTQDWGTTYVEVDLTGQHVYMTKDGAVVWDAPCVTGNVSKNYTTPPGIFPLTYKERDRVLRGPKQADGTYEYETPVSYWMPFNGGIGLHDANWRGSFGGTIYKTSGSHGCINLPPSKVPALYEMVYKGMPVICYN